MSKHIRSKPIRECGATGKLYYSDEEKADKAAHNYEHRFHTAMASYFCKYCKGFHLTTINKKRENRHERLSD